MAANTQLEWLASVNEAVGKMELMNIRYVRLTWVDLLNNVRYRVMTRAHFSRLCAGSSRGMSAVKAVLALAFLTPIHNEDYHAETGEHVYIPDPSTMRVLGYAKDQVSMYGFWELKEKPEPVSICPRTILKGIVEKAKQTHGINFLVGFETEVILLKLSNLPEPANEYLYCDSAALVAGTPEMAAVEEIADALQDQGIDLHLYHSEGAPGQYEFVTGPQEPLKAADALLCTRQTIMNIANKHGFRATFAPRIYPDWPGSAAHAHISLRSSRPTGPASGANVASAPGLSQLEASFLQGLLSHLPAICAITLPLEASYDRVTDGVWSGGSYVAWGSDNRETPIRLTGGRSAYRFEVRCNDGTSNPYVSLAAMLAGGMLGVRAGANLSMGDAKVMPAHMSETDRHALGIRTRLPLSQQEAHQRLKDDKEFVNELGEELVSLFIAAHKELTPQLNCETPEESMRKLVMNF